MTSFCKGPDGVPVTLELHNCAIEYIPNANNAGKPFVQMGAGDELIEKNVGYACSTGEPLRGERIVEQAEVVAEVLHRSR